ncbi:MAG: PepSY domain-containing protein [Synergistes jonesii]|uniref:PepSY domain-containing protein n=1 Tax=Synergistes jonesii TaxID=2754 RepID=UPI00248DEDF4|nr:PepSY domain-containing protein [Synergistes jonesii]MDY2985002.1 PepSY domain-containing protein [Synergistes jonesii]
MKRTAILAAAAAVLFAALSAHGAELIGEAKAKEIALKHAGVEPHTARFTKTEFDREHGRAEYELEFFAGGVEYDYEIDAESGEVCGFSHERRGGAPGEIGGPATIGEDEARRIALSRVRGATEGDVRKLRLENEDGRKIYQCEIFYGGREYEFEIDAGSGEVLKLEADR